MAVTDDYVMNNATEYYAQRLTTLGAHTALCCEIQAILRFIDNQIIIHLQHTLCTPAE